MSYIYSLEKALNYIEEHLYEDVDLSSIAKEAGYSLYHFHRIFKSVVGDSIKDYIRKRRITEAAKELVYTNNPIVDIGVKYGYESREAFSRAFEKIYGRNPSEVRKNKSLYFVFYGSIKQIYRTIVIYFLGKFRVLSASRITHNCGKMNYSVKFIFSKN